MSSIPRPPETDNLQMNEYLNWLYIILKNPGYTAVINDGELLIGKTNGEFALDTLTAGSGISIVNGDGTITIDTVPEVNTFTEVIYSAAVINLGLVNDGSFVDVDATNAKIDFTVNVVGKYRIEFQFPHTWEITNGGVFTFFRFTDGTTNSKAIQSGAQDQGTTITFTNPVNFSAVFNFTTTGSKTVKLQKRNASFSGTIIRNVIESDNSVERALIMRAYKISN